MFKNNKRKNKNRVARGTPHASQQREIKALKKVVRDLQSNPFRQTAKQSTVGLSTSSISARKTRVKGTEFLRSHPGVDESGHGPLVSLNIGPGTFNSANSRLAHLFELYERYFVHDIKFEFVPTVAKTTPGIMHCVPDWDPSDAPPAVASESEIVKRLSNMYHFKSGAVCDKLTVSMKNEKLASGRWFREDLYTDDSVEIRSSTYGILRAITTGYNSTTTPGNWYIKYDISFQIPSIKERPSYTSIGDLMMEIPATTDPKTFDKDVPVTTPFAVIDDMGAPYHLNPNAIYKGVLDAQGAAVILDDRLNVVPDGTTVYWKAAERNMTDGGNAGAQAIGEMALDETFSENLKWISDTLTYVKILTPLIKLLN